jgi:hypothetical protein
MSTWNAVIQYHHFAVGVDVRAFMPDGLACEDKWFKTIGISILRGICHITYHITPFFV